VIAALALALTAAAGTREYEILPRTIEWSELSPAHYDLAWRLPPIRAQGERDLTAELRALLALELADGGARLSFGDLAARTRALGKDERRAWLGALLERQPALGSGAREALSELLLDDRLFSERWDPEDDHARDGILIGPAWDLGAERAAPWSELDVRPLLEQGAVFVRADLATIQAAENDYRVYRERPGAEFEAIWPVPGSYVVGRDPAGRPFAALELFFESDLPFPFTSYTCDLAILKTVSDEGLLVTEIVSRSRDFHWFAGRDLYLPVTASDGAPQGFVVARVYGFDLDGIPDRASHRRAALRSSLGCWRR
jgi:hypothetical protein